MKLPKIKFKKPSKREVMSTGAWIMGCVGMALYGVHEHRRGVEEMADIANDQIDQVHDKGGEVMGFETEPKWNRINIRTNYCAPEPVDETE